MIPLSDVLHLIELDESLRMLKGASLSQHIGEKDRVGIPNDKPDGEVPDIRIKYNPTTHNFEVY